MHALTDIEPHYGSLTAPLYRQRFLVGACVLLGIAAGLFIYSESPRQYVAQSVVALNARRAEILPTEAVLAPQRPDMEEVRTELDAIDSRAMTAVVVQRLGKIPLSALPKPGGIHAFAADVVEWVKAALVRLRLLSEPKARTGDDDIVGRVLDGLKVSNDGRSYTIYIQYTASNPEFAARVAQAYADAYLTARSQVVSGVASSASKWLGGNLDALRRKVLASETALQDYRRQTGLLGDKDSPLQAETIGELNRELVSAQSDVATAQARLQTALQLQQGQSAGQSFPAALNSPVMQQLSEAETRILAQIDELERAGLTRSPQLPGLRANLALIQRRLNAQANQLVAGLRAELEAAQGKEARIEQGLERAKQSLGVARAATVRLQQLKSEAKANRSVYESFLTRYKQTIEQVNFQAPDAQLLSSAQVPEAPASPRLLTLLALGIVGGGALGVALAFWRNRTDTRLRLPSELEELAQIPVLAAISDIRPLRLGGTPKLPVRQDARKALGRLAATLQFYRPTSRAGVLAITSSLPGEGRTCFAIALARYFGTTGRKVVVVDTDRARTRVARRPQERNGITMGKRRIDGALESDSHFPVDFLHAGELIVKHGLLRNDLLLQLLAGLRQHYDVILMDTPALSEGAEGVQLSAASDAVLLVARLGKVERAAVRESLRQLALCGIPVTGIVALGSDKVSHWLGDVARPVLVIPEVDSQPPARPMDEQPAHPLG